MPPTSPRTIYKCYEPFHNHSRSGVHGAGQVAWERPGGEGAACPEVHGIRGSARQPVTRGRGQGSRGPPGNGARHRKFARGEQDIACLGGGGTDYRDIMARVRPG